MFREEFGRTDRLEIPMVEGIVSDDRVTAMLSSPIASRGFWRDQPAGFARNPLTNSSTWGSNAKRRITTLP
jgi:hypothetical protein